jgi:hypothetical protein
MLSDTESSNKVSIQEKMQRKRREKNKIGGVSCATPNEECIIF